MRKPGYFRWMAAVGWLAAGAALGAPPPVGVSPQPATFPPTAAYPPALENPVVDGAFTTVNEYRGANRVRDDQNVGWFYKQHRQNWVAKGVTYPNTLTFFDTHLFTDPAYGQLDLYDMNSWDYEWGDVAVEVWVFEKGNNSNRYDYLWLGMSGIGVANYPTGIDDDDGFLVRLNHNPATDKRWKPGMAEPGDPGWDFRNFYGVFARAGFNTSAYVNNYVNIPQAREIYEFSITLNRIPGTGPNGTDGGLPGIPQFGGGLGGGPGRGGGGGGSGAPGDEANPPAPPPCDPIWEKVTKWKKVCDWNIKMGGHGDTGGTGWVPDGTEWVFMGWDDSMHAVPEGFDVQPVDGVAIEH